MKNNETREVCTTQEAANMLGISVTSVQQLVEAGAIEAWRTRGGHRRIPLAAVLAYQALLAGTPEPKSARRAGRRTNVLVIEDNEMQRALYDKQISSWNLAADVNFCDNGYQALLEIASEKPDVVLADIVMAGMDGYEVINTILAYPQLADVNIAILSSMSPADLEARGGVPEGVVFFAKPVNYDELRGYLRACCAQTERRAQAAGRKTPKN
ncbi:MAG: response regulator [Duganella sp.]